jgi:type VI protein secretion system component VasF
MLDPDETHATNLSTALHNRSDSTLHAFHPRIPLRLDMRRYERRAKLTLIAMALIVVAVLILAMFR